MKILAVAGASGGHIYPAIGFLDDFKSAYPDSQTLLVLPMRSIKQGIVIEGHPIRPVSVSTLSLKPSWKNIVAAANFIKGFFEAVVIVGRFKPDIVVGFGSIASIPVVLCAWLFRTTVLIHEQNVLPGRANRFLAFISDRIAIAFPETKKFFASYSSKSVWTGNMVRRSLVVIDKSRALEYFNLSAGKRTILVMGGSQSSRRINFCFARSFKDLAWKDNCQVIHLCGQADKADLEKEYALFNASVRLVPFLSQMEYAYSAADIVISRAGATTISELMVYCIPAILVPYPYAYAHQDANARILSNAGCAVLVKDAEIDRGALLRALEGVALPGALDCMKKAYAGFTKEKPASLVSEAVKIHCHD